MFRNSLDQTYNHRDPFLNTVIVGVIRLFDLTALDILAFNLSTHQSAVVQSDTHYVRITHYILFTSSYSTFRMHKWGPLLWTETFTL